MVAMSLFPPAPTCRFWLGTHMTNWLGFLGVPLFVSRRRLAMRKSFPRAAAPWALDSGGFTEIETFGKWMVLPRDYAAEVRRYRDEVGMMEWAAVQDWMCEPKMLEKSGLTVAEHQARSIQSFLDLRDIAPDIPWAPVIQGWEPDDYLRCVDDYARAGVDLRDQPIVGVGSVCRRQATAEAADIFRRLHRLDLRIHGFGVKIEGLAISSRWLASSDSLAWSHGARHGKVRLPGHRHKNCANCPEYAMQWRSAVLAIPGMRT